MRGIKWLLILTFLTLVSLFLHYTLPGRDIVQIVGTDTTRMDIGNSSIFWAAPDGKSAVNGTRDVRFINTVRENGKSRVFRNEDTGWGWPPYFKFDSGDITAQAQELANKQDVWVAVTHYGWRITFWSAFPNVLEIERVDGPDTRLIPWFNIVFFVLLLTFLIFIYRIIAAFKRRNIDPVIEDIDEMLDDAGEGIDEAKSQALAAKKSALDWIKGLFGKTPPSDQSSR